MLKRVWAWEVLACACGARRRIRAAVQAGPVSEKILRHLGLPTELPLDERSQVQAENDIDQRLAESEVE